MYSPKIREDLIPILYRIGKEQEKPMTTVVDEILRDYIILRQKRSALDHEGLLDNLIDSHFKAGYVVFRLDNSANSGGLYSNKR